MSLHEPIFILAQLAGLDVSYTSWRDEPVVASEPAVLAALCALGVELSGVEDAPAAIAALQAERAREIVPPVIVAWDGELVVPFAVTPDRDGDWQIMLSQDGEGRGTAGRRGQPAVMRLDGWGYYHLSWQLGRAAGEALVISAPLQAAGAPDLSSKHWGVFAPLYGLASPETGQTGDLSSLRRLFRAVARRGGHYVATLPILAAAFDDPGKISPYSPVSRLFWNELYLDLRALAAELGAPPPVAPPASSGAAIDYGAQYRWQRDALEPLVRALLSDPARAAAIDAWAVDTGTYDYAAFRALGEQARTPWADWPAAQRDGVPVVASRDAALAIGAAGARVDLHVAAQWAMARQLAALRRSPVSLYLDLPVGVSHDAYDVWRHRSLFLRGLSTGAPPDALFLGGQNWGLPPLSPEALRRDDYRYFRRCVRHHMAVAGMLRIDHVMGLFRLYCVPEGMAATDGVYVRYHADELLAILALESHLAGCALAGEDLGTVPRDVRPAMARHGLFRLHVGQWAFPSTAGDAPAPSPPDAIASLNTHDMPTFAGWWRGLDIDDRRDLGLITDEQHAVEHAERARQRTALSALADAQGVDASLTDVERAMVAATADLAAGSAEIVLLSLDDLALEPAPHNVPGTTHQRPNWQRRVPGWTDALDEDRATPAAAAAIAAVLARR